MAPSPSPSSRVPQDEAVIWLDLATSELDRSQAFYYELFDWDYKETATSKGSHYTATIGDQPVAGLMAQAETPESDGPSWWTVFFPSSDLRADVARVVDAGGSVVTEPFEIPGSDGEWVAVVADPSGAIFALATFQETQSGSMLWDVPGAGSWVECHTWDIEASLAFYRTLFGWESETNGDYHLLLRAGRPIAGLMAVPDGVPDGVPSYWFVYWRVDEMDAALARAESAGGTVMTPTMDIDEGRFTVVEDPTGSVVGLFEGRVGLADALAGSEPARAEQLIGSLTSSSVVSVEPKTTLRTVIDQVIEAGVGLVVVDDTGSVAGVVGEHDVLEAIHDGAELDDVWAADIMKTDLVTARSDDTLMDVARRMVDERVRHVLVFGDNGGVVSVRDVLEAMVAERSSVPVASPSSARTHRSPPILRP